MVLGEITNLIKQGGTTRSTDLVDKLNFTVTPFLFILFATFTTMRMFVGDTIKCWTENDFTLQKNQYTDNMCWVSNTYWLPNNMEPAHGKREGRDEEISYYQWTAIILIALAVSWYLVALVWRFYISRHMDLETILKFAESTRINIDPNTRHKFVNETLSKHFKIYIQRNRNSYKISLAYMAVKIVCLTLPVLQITFLSSLFGEGYVWYGIDIIQKALRVQMADIKPVRFPVVAWCDFFRVVPGNMQRYTVHCVLAANLFNRAIFGVVWFWLIFSFMVTGINWLIWIFRLFAKFFSRRYANTRQNYLRELLIISNDIREDVAVNQKWRQEQRLFQFSKYLGCDVNLILRLIGANTSQVVSCELVSVLYHQFFSPPNSPELGMGKRNRRGGQQDKEGGGDDDSPGAKRRGRGRRKSRKPSKFDNCRNDDDGSDDDDDDDDDDDGDDDDDDDGDDNNDD